MSWVYKFMIISMAAAVAAGFVFLWHKWNTERTVMWLVLSIIITVIVALSIVFAAASLVIMLLGL